MAASTPDPRIDGFIRQGIDETVAFFQEHPHSEVLTGLNNVSISIKATTHVWPSGIDPLGGFIPLESSRRSGDKWEIYFIENSQNFQMPAGTWPNDWHYPLGVVSRTYTGDLHLAIDRHTGSVSALDPSRKRGFVWIPSYSSFPYWAAATPFRLLISWIAEHYNVAFIHGAAIGTDENSLLLVGPSGAGKSSASFLAQSAGFWIQSDDFILVDGRHSMPIYTRAKVHDSSPAIVASKLTPLNLEKEGEKRIVTLPRSPSSASIKGIVVVSRSTDGQSTISEIQKSEVLRSLVLPSASGLLGGSAKQLSMMKQLISSTKTFEWRRNWNSSSDLSALNKFWMKING